MRLCLTNLMEGVRRTAGASPVGVLGPPQVQWDWVTFRGVVLSLCLFSGAVTVVAAAPKDGSPLQTTVRTERYPRPPYSGATYYIYERAGAAICTKLEVCNKFGDCHASYHQGSYKTAEDQRGEPYGASPAAPIAVAKLNKHICLVRYRLNGV